MIIILTGQFSWTRKSKVPIFYCPNNLRPSLTSSPTLSFTEASVETSIRSFPPQKLFFPLLKGYSLQILACLIPHHVVCLSGLL